MAPRQDTLSSDPLAGVIEYAPLLPEHPVFVTHDGRPRRKSRLIASSLAIALSAWIAAIVVGGTGFASMPKLQFAPLAHRPALTSRAQLRLAAERRERPKQRDSGDVARATAKRSTPAST